MTFKVGNLAHSSEVSPTEHVKVDKPMLGNCYRENTLNLSKDKIADLYSSGVIYDTRRPRNIYIDGWIVTSLAKLENKGA